MFVTNGLVSFYSNVVFLVFAPMEYFTVTHFESVLGVSFKHILSVLVRFMIM